MSINVLNTFIIMYIRYHYTSMVDHTIALISSVIPFYVSATGATAVTPEYGIPRATYPILFPVEKRHTMPSAFGATNGVIAKSESGNIRFRSRWSYPL